MSTIATYKESTYELPTPGCHAAVCAAVVDMGTQHDEKFQSDRAKIRITWELVDETYKVDDQDVRFQVGKEYTRVLSPKSSLKKDLEAWCGLSISAKEAQSIDMKNFLNTGCLLQIVHNEGSERTYANVNAIMSLPAGQRVAPAAKPLLFDMDDANTYANFYLLPRWLQERIAQSPEFANTGLELPPQEETAGKEPAAVPVQAVPATSAPSQPTQAGFMPAAQSAQTAPQQPMGAYVQAPSPAPVMPQANMSGIPAAQYAQAMPMQYVQAAGVPILNGDGDLEF